MKFANASQLHRKSGVRWGEGAPSSSSRPFDASDLSNPSIPTKPLIPQISDISILGSLLSL
jgi:hypothetical protein